MSAKPSDWIEWCKWLRLFLNRIEAADTTDATIIEIEATASQLMDWNHRAIPPDAPRVWCVMRPNGTISTAEPAQNVAQIFADQMPGYTIRPYALIPVEDAE